MPKRPRSSSGSASAKKRRRYGVTPYKYRKYKPTYVRSGFGAIGRTPGGAVLGEMKYFDSRLAATALPSAAAWTGTEFDPATMNTLFVPVVGAAVNQRIGKEVKVMKIKIHGQINIAPLESAIGRDGCQIRLALIMDKQTNASQAQGEQVFTPTTTALEAPLTFQNIDNFGRFIVLSDKTITMQDPNWNVNPGGTDSNGLVKTFKISYRFKYPISVRFNATNGGTVADIVDNSFHIMANCSNISLSPTISYLCRVCYKE